MWTALLTTVTSKPEPVPILEIIGNCFCFCCCFRVRVIPSLSLSLSHSVCLSFFLASLLPRPPGHQSPWFLLWLISAITAADSWDDPSSDQSAICPVEAPSLAEKEIRERKSNARWIFYQDSRAVSDQIPRILQSPVDSRLIFANISPMFHQPDWRIGEISHRRSSAKHCT